MQHNRSFPLAVAVAGGAGDWDMKQGNAANSTILLLYDAILGSVFW